MHRKNTSHLVENASPFLLRLLLLLLALLFLLTKLFVASSLCLLCGFSIASVIEILIKSSVTTHLSTILFILLFLCMRELNYACVYIYSRIIDVDYVGFLAILTFVSTEDLVSVRIQ